MDQSQNKPNWKDIPDGALEREVRDFFASNPKLRECWVVTCRYEDGEPTTCSAQSGFPYSDTSRRHFRRSERLEEVFGA